MNAEISLWDLLIVDLSESFFLKPSQQELDRLDNAFKTLVPNSYEQLANMTVTMN